VAAARSLSVAVTASRRRVVAPGLLTVSTSFQQNFYNGTSATWKNERIEVTPTATAVAEPAEVHPDDKTTAIAARQRIVIAVGGNALQRRGERLTIEK